MIIIDFFLLFQTDHRTNVSDEKVRQCFQPAKMMGIRMYYATICTNCTYIIHAVMHGRVGHRRLNRRGVE